MIFRIARDVYFRSDIYNRMLRKQVAARLHPLAIDPMPGDATRGAAFLNGDMILAGRRRPVGAHPFDADIKSRQAIAELHGFSWLRDLAALSAPTAREGAAMLVRDWLNHHDRWHAVTWAPDVAATRVLAWISHLDLVTESGGEPLRADMAQSAAAQLKHLAGLVRNRRALPADPETACAIGTALIAGAIAIPDQEAWMAPGLDCLKRVIARDFGSDGGPTDRSPETALAILALLVQARLALRAAKQQTPDFLADALARLGPAVKTTQMGDGALAAFNGGGNAQSPMVSAVLAAAGVKGAPPRSLPDWGFERLQGGQTVIVADAGAAHRGALSFEMSAGRHRLVVNCGAHPDETTEWARVLRATAAHSTLTINDTDALPTDGARRAELGLTVRRNEREGSSLVQLGHEGYRKAFGIVHNRDLYLSEAGDDFRGKDSLVGGAGAFSLRFHLHPDVGAMALEGGDAVLLKLPGGKGWRFRCSGARPVLEESVYLGDPVHPRRSQQIVLRGDHHQPETIVRWSFLREGA